MRKLTIRERRLTISSVALVIIWSIYAFILGPAKERIATLSRVVPEKQHALASLTQLSQCYRTLREDIENIQWQIAQQPDELTFLANLEELLAECDLAKNRRSMRPHYRPIAEKYVEISITLDFEDVAVSQLIEFLTKLRSLNNMAIVKSINLKTSNSPKGLPDATVQIAVLQPSHSL